MTTKYEQSHFVLMSRSAQTTAASPGPQTNVLRLPSFESRCMASEKGGTHAEKRRVSCQQWIKTRTTAAVRVCLQPTFIQSPRTHEREVTLSYILRLHSA